MITSFQVQKIHFYPGIKFGLSTKTAIVKIAYKRKIDYLSSSQSNFINNFKELAPADDFYINMIPEWEKFFLFPFTEKITLAHNIIGLTTAIQLWARDPVWKGRVLHISDDTMLLAVPWEQQNVFKSALLFALKYIVLWSDRDQKASAIQQLSDEYRSWLSQVQEKGLAPNTLRFALSALQRNIPVTLQSRQIRLGSGKNGIRMDSSFTGNTSVLSTKIAKNKLETNMLLRLSLIPAPIAAFSATYQNTLELIKKIPFPVVIKPLNQDQGIGITTNIRNTNDLQGAFNVAKKYSPHGVIIEKHIQGDDYRMLVVGNKLLMTTKRIPGGVIGDGRNNIKQLLDLLNEDYRRGTDKRSLLKKILLDDEAKILIAEQKLTVGSILEKDQFVKLRHTANISSGGTAVDVTDIVHSDNRFIAQRAAEVIGLDVAGVDFLSPDISKSWREVGGVVIEVNAQPGFRPHWLSLPDRDINGEIIDQLFQSKPARIPTAAITGTNGKTTTAKMLHQIWMSSGKNAGVTTTNGVWIGKDMISDDNLSGNPGGRILLNDPTVEAAIIEMPRKGLIIFGHPVDRYDVAALLNIKDDHIGVDGINSIEEMAILKSEVLYRARQAVVVNAEDPLCLKAAQKIDEQKLVLVSMDRILPSFREHIEKGGAGVCIKSIDHASWIMLIEKNKETPLIKVSEVPATIGGSARFNISNAMFATGLAWVQNLSLQSIRRGLSSFRSTVEQNPGRLNFIEGFPFKVLLDFSHNPDTIKKLIEFINNISVTGKKRIILQTLGNRHRSHLWESAPMLVETFDTFTLSCIPERIRHNPEWNSDDPIDAMLQESLQSILTQKISKEAVEVVSDQEESIRKGLESAKPGDLLVILAPANITIPILNAVLQEKSV